MEYQKLIYLLNLLQLIYHLNLEQKVALKELMIHVNLAAETAKFSSKMNG